MRVVVHGAGGKVGAALCAQIAEAADLTLGEAIMGRADLPGATFSGDVVVDFSAPAGTMALLDRLAGTALPLVIGTTGFDDGDLARIRAASAHRPILMANNFTLGFEAFRTAARLLADLLPQGQLTVAEVYKLGKKPVASGTTQQLVADLSTPDRIAGTAISRIGDTPGINTVSFDLGVSRVDLTMTVASRDAYAAGALAAARWLRGKSRGLYSNADIR